ncbi:DUF3038 domain-containing protein [Spirulina subsalsa FACHB-351]|uniref:DUF3038 domain-containing protein n=1 Tax=Spirulina subsalsa FACHB-351 TaxID=234711 RepID=A0ABT3L9V7_9CYAN|nr:DUF3038 domain-containing protein [Spirulina subsalsa]MCW6038294.1 DUF3038 domain-containing protein [Spirulina subsalsa FACHB-351]
MYSTVQQSPSTSPWEELSLQSSPSAGQLDNIKTHLDLLLLALESLSGIGSKEILQAVAYFKLESLIGDRVALWRLRQSNPERKSSGGRKKLDVEEARALVLVICHLAHQEQELIRRGIMLLEQMTAQEQDPCRVALLGDYIDTFSNTYLERRGNDEDMTPEALKDLGFKLLIDLLFYSAVNGHRRLWLALFDSAQG